VVTVIDDVVAPVLHKSEPVAVVESVELPQLLATVTSGIAGIALGAAVPLPAPLLHPFTVVATV
jgi:hypothetical protein